VSPSVRRTLCLRLRTCETNRPFCAALISSSVQIETLQDAQPSIQLGAERSAVHSLLLTLIYNGQQEPYTAPVILDMLVPRSGWKKRTAYLTGSVLCATIRGRVPSGKVCVNP
jgi:hypothetical protein